RAADARRTAQAVHTSNLRHPRGGRTGTVAVRGEAAGERAALAEPDRGAATTGLDGHARRQPGLRRRPDRAVRGPAAERTAGLGLAGDAAPRGPGTHPASLAGRRREGAKRIRDRAPLPTVRRRVPLVQDAGGGDP